MPQDRFTPPPLLPPRITRSVGKHGDPDAARRAQKVLGAQTEAILEARGEGKEKKAPAAKPAASAPAPQDQAAPVADNGAPPGNEEQAVLPSSPAASEVEGQEPEAEEQEQAQQRRSRFQERINRLSGKNREKDEAIELLKEQNRLLATALAGRNGQQPQQQTPVGVPFQEPFPIDGTPEQQQDWREGKRIHDMASQQALQMAAALEQRRAPLDNEMRAVLLEREWSRQEGKLQRWARPLGMTTDELRNEMEPFVQELYRNPANMSRTLGSVLHDVADHLDLDGEPSMQSAPPPNVSRPGAGRSAIPSAPKTTEKPEKTRKSVLEEARQLGRQGKTREAEALLRKAMQEGISVFPRKERPLRGSR